jgi:hypothetical protein
MKRQMASQLDHADVVRVVVEFELGVGGRGGNLDRHPILAAKAEGLG